MVAGLTGNDANNTSVEKAESSTRLAVQPSPVPRVQPLLVKPLLVQHRLVQQRDEEDAGGPALRISGELTLSNTEIRGLPAGGTGGTSVLLSAPLMDVSLQIGRNVRFVTPTLRADLVGEIDVSGTPRDPHIIGTVTTRNGLIRFPNTSARLQQGEIAIDVSRDPITRELRSRVTIDATARGQVGRYQITVVLRGPLDMGDESTQNLRVDVTSNPPLSQDEAFAQLTGTSLRDVNGGFLSGGEANQTYARAVVSLLSAPLFAGIERSLEQALGLTNITLDYRLDEPVNIQLGKALNDRVYVTYRRTLTGGSSSITQPAYTLRIDYRLAGGVQIGGQIDERGRKQITVEKTIRF
jgi:autotransporter translocation and assembly factor TamB